ncbi:hypothetical protein [Pedobacter sp. Leaf250]|uniref:hypothetical protein n=1 Tax=Pedobacter sp. Leaf250 TaxID=2876559 RepID=UPI001E333146|nr:hypothetical protein [Pedobacter sp. Leaf250]
MKQNLSLLNRQERHEGYLYWNGKPDSRIIQGTKMAMLTEKIAKALGATKTSSYYASFKKDSLTVEKLMQTTRADETIQPNMNGFLQKEILGEYILPFQFMDLKNVSSITLKPNGKEELTFKFNKSGQLVEYIDGKDEHQIITYKDNLPLNISRDGKLKIHLFYQGNVVSVKDDYSLESYELIGKLFLESARYSIEKSDYEELKIKGEREYKIFQRNGQTCLDYSSEDKAASICYSNNQWILPITMTETYGGDSQTKTLSINAAGALEVENANKYKSSKMIYKLENGIIKTFHSTQKRGENEYAEPKAIQVIYTFFK